VEFAVFAARVGVGRKITEEGYVEFAAGEAGIEDFAVDAGGDGAEAVRVEMADEFACIAFPEGKESGHADAREISLAVGAEVFKEDISEGDSSNALVIEVEKRLFHAGFVDGIDALWRDRNFVQREAERFGLTMEKFSADAVHGDAIVILCDGGEKGDDAELLLLEKRVQRHGTVFAAAPAEEDGFRCGHLQWSVISLQLSVRKERNLSFSYSFHFRILGHSVFLCGEEGAAVLRLYKAIEARQRHQSRPAKR
jgi:hypothetical protein